MVGDQGIEPRMPEAPDLQSGVVTNATRHPYYGTPYQNRTGLPSVKG